jgi:hypothetical protein
MYLQITENTEKMLDQWLADYHKGPYNLAAWVERANEALNNKLEGESRAEIELRSYQTWLGKPLTFNFNYLD